MPKIKKKFDITISKRFPDGSIGSIAYGTSIETSVEVVNEKVKKECFEEVYQSTISDIKNSAKIDSLVRSIWKQIRQQLENERLVQDAERKNFGKKEKSKRSK